MYNIRTVCSIIDGSFLTSHSDNLIDQLVYDSRRVQQPELSLFFAIKTDHNDGHKYLPDAYRKGIRNFVVSEPVEPNPFPSSNIILVKDVLHALHQLAIFHRSHFSIPVVGVTGSNGKTIVKEWLYQLLQDEFTIVRSPRSFNSQIGVPLSVWQMKEQHTLGIFEAGISMPGEMEKLESIIQPAIGILTNIGEAHNAHFSTAGEKLAEKMKLFRHAAILIGPYDLLSSAQSSLQLFSWGDRSGATLQIASVSTQKHTTSISAKYKGAELSITIPFTDEASVQNAITCWCVLLYLTVDYDLIPAKFARLHTVDMRLQLKHGSNGCMIINDTYNADITSLKIALDFLKQQSAGLERTVILSEFFESGRADEDLYIEIESLLRRYKIKKAYAVGEKIKTILQAITSPSIDLHTYLSTDDFIKEFKSSSFHNQIILIKGARIYEFERIVQLFENKLHQTVLNINLNAIVHNLKEYQKLLRPGTKVMAMVKAFSYGSGGAEIASVLEYHNVNYLGVAYADEGMELVKAGINLPVMVMNAEESSFQAIVDYSLQPVIYSFDLFYKFERYLKEQGLQSYPVHIEIESGMNRLGFAIQEVERLADHISASAVLKIESVFSHLAASEDPDQDPFTMKQAGILEQAADLLRNKLDYSFLMHVANSAAIVRHPQLQMDMVRLGIGLYGVEPDNEHSLDLQAVATLRSTIAQLKAVKKGESVSYNRKGIVHKDSLIATLRIGYADGYSRQFSNGTGKVWINGKLAPVVGSVCMDMTMVDVTDIASVKEGDEAILFGPQLPVQRLAAWINTIPYELMTAVSQRVRRVYFHD